MNLFLSVAPIILLIYLMTKKNGVPAYIALPLTALIIFLIQFFYWGGDQVLLYANIIVALGKTITPITIIFGAILFNKFMEVSGAIDIIRKWLSGINKNPVVQLMIIAWAFAFMIEGASGFGTPAAIAAPLLVSLGFRALPIAMLALVMNSVPVSFGAVGTPTWFGFGSLNLGAETILEIGSKTSIIHFIAALFIPAAALRLVVSWNEIRKNLVYIYISIFACIIPYVLIAQFNYEFPSLVGGGIGLIISVIVAKFGIGISKDINYEECGLDASKEITNKEQEDVIPTSTIFKALVPFLLLIGILVITRIHQLGIKGLLTNSTPILNLNFGFLGDFSISQSLTFKLSKIFTTGANVDYKLLYVPALIPFFVTVFISILLFKVKGKEVGTIFSTTLKSVKNPFIALFGALLMVQFMLVAGKELPSMVKVIGNSLGDALGSYWIIFASYLGAIGAFFSGSNTVSNLTFGGIQQSIAQETGLNLGTTLALQSVGGAMGNMVCLNNIIAVCTVTDVKNLEGYIIKKTSVYMFSYGIIALITVLVLQLLNIW